MGVAWYWTRAELRQRWRTWLSIALIVGIGGGLAMGSLAGARRTQSAYPRFLEQADPPDLTLDPDFGADSPEFLDAVEALPDVVGRADAHALALGQAVDGTIDLGGVGTAIASVDGDRFYVRDRVHVTEGRMPDPDSTDEVLVSESVAADGVEVGDTILYVVLDVATLFGLLESGTGEIPADSGPGIDVTVTGIGIFPERVVVDEDYAAEVVLVPPALFAALPEDARLWSRMGVFLAEGAERGAVQRQIKQLAAELGGDVLFEDRADITDRAQRAVRPYVLALAGLGSAGAVFVTLLGMQLVRRARAQSRPEELTLRALSIDRRQRRLATALPAVLAAIGATVLAIAVSTAVSQWTPVGPVRPIEPDPGPSIDWAVTGPGLLLVVLVLTVPAIAVRRHGAMSRSSGGLLAAWAVQTGAPLPLVLGLGRATGSGDDAGRGAARSGLLAVGISIVMLVAVATFAASLDRLVNEPEVHGWNSDVAIVGEGGYGDLDLKEMAGVDGVEAMSGAIFGNVSVNDTNVPGMGVIAVRGRLHPPIVSGRMPAGMGEIALGRRSIAELDVVIGETVEVRLPQAEAMTMTVVGIAVLPGLGFIDNDRPSLGDGALLSLPAEEIDGDFTWSAAFIDLESDADADSTTAELVLAADVQTGDTDVFDLFRPADVAAFAELGSVPFVLVAMFGAVAVASLVHVLLVTARAWRRDRAVLSALGAAPVQLRSAVRWQAAITLVLALVVASPIGVTIGRWSWRSLAEEIGIAPDPVLPGRVFIGLVVVLVVTAALVTGIPDRRSRQLGSVATLRAE